MISVCFQGKSFNITVIQVYAPTSNAEEAEVEWFYEDLQNLLELTPKKRCPFHYRGSNAKVGSQETWSNRQVWPWNTKWSRAKANRVLPQFHDNSLNFSLTFFADSLFTSLLKETTLVIANIFCQQHKTRLYMNVTRWSTKIRLIIFFVAKDGEALYSWQKQDLELTVAQIMSSLLPNSDFNWRK